MLKEKEMFNRAYDFMERHYNDIDFGELDQEGGLANEYYKLQKDYRGSQLWQELLVLVMEHIERKMDYERKKANEAKSR